MRLAKSVLAVAVILMAFVGVALAAQMSGEVKVVDAGKGTLTLSSESINVGFDCETGSLISDVKVGDKVTVEYTNQDGKKIVTKVTQQKKKPAVGC